MKSLGRSRYWWGVACALVALSASQTTLGLSLRWGGDTVGAAEEVVAEVIDTSSGSFQAFLSSISMIIVSELGDKTFFIAAIMAMRHNRLVVFSGAFCALIVMTVLSAALGMTLPSLLPASLVHWASTMLFLIFGVKLLKDGYQMDPGESNDELEEVEEELQKKEREMLDLEQSKKRALESSVIFMQALSMTFLAEWGDRSQIATIALAAAKDAIFVTLGGIIGHGICTGLAVLGGRVLAANISERTVTLVGGVLFLIFGVHSLFFET